MATLEHPDQSWEAIQRARSGATKNPAPPRGVKYVPENVDLGSQPAKPKYGEPGFEYERPKPPALSREQIFEAMKSAGLDFSELKASLDGLMLQNETLRDENVQLRTRAEAAENALRAVRQSETPKEDIAEAEFENVDPSHE